MIDLKNYVPEHPEFKLPKSTSFPKVIFEGAKNMDEVRKQLSGKFIAESTPGVKAIRLLDAYERASIRANYSELMEDEQPKLEDAIAEVEAQCKAIIKEAKDKLQAVTTQIRDLVYQVKRGDKEVDLPGESTMRMALCGITFTTHGLTTNSNFAGWIRFRRGTSRVSSLILKPTSRHSSKCWVST